jgi:ATP-dependent exoDNAse (exonuclease V) beta subunit
VYSIAYSNIREKEREAESRWVFYVAPTRARDHLILTSTEREADKLCGLMLLRPGLEAAHVECQFVPFRPEVARSPELPAPLPDAPSRMLVEPVLVESVQCQH